MTKSSPSNSLSMLIVASCAIFCVGYGDYAADGLWKVRVTEKPCSIEVSGENGNSGLLLKRVSLETHKKQILLRCHYCFLNKLRLKKKQSGVSDNGLTNFEVRIPPTVEQVLLGKERVVIWSRKKEASSSQDPKPPGG